VIGETLIDMRKSSGKTQKEIAARIDVDIRTLRDYESNKTEIPAVKLFQVIAFCQFDLASILERFKNFREGTTVKKGHGQGMHYAKFMFINLEYLK
jgi:transcriptional regulator with XRE-family HTH domain